MNALPPRTTSYAPPHPEIHHSLGPTPALLLSRDDPIFFFLEACMLYNSKSIFPSDASAVEYARVRALSAATGRPIIFFTTPLELQLIDQWKKEAKDFAIANGHARPKSTNLRYWCRGAEGRGIAKYFPNMRYTGFAHQYMVLSQVRSIRIGLDHLR
jgi:hypothetical protein